MQKVAAIIVTYNRKKLLLKNLLNSLNQTHQLLVAQLPAIPEPTHQQLMHRLQQLQLRQSRLDELSQLPRVI